MVTSPSWLSMNCPGPSPLMTWPFVIFFLPPNFYSAVEVLGHETAKLQISCVLAHSECVGRAFSGLPRPFTSQSLMNTHCLGNFIFCNFPRKTCSFPFPVGRKSPCCALLKNPGSEQTWVAVCTAGSDCCCCLRWGPSCICRYIWKNHWGKLGGFFCKWTLQAWASLVLSQFSLCKTQGGIQCYKWIQWKMDKCWWSDPLQAEPSGIASD